MDLALDLLVRAQEDDDTGIFVGRVSGTTIDVMFVPDVAAKLLFVVLIHEWSS